MNISPGELRDTSSGGEELLDGSSSQKNSVNNGGDLGGGTGIKIRTRQTQDRPSDDNFEPQGTARRRIRLQMKVSPGKLRDTSSSEEEHEAQSTITEAIEGTIHTPNDEPEVESRLLEFDENREIAQQTTSKLMSRVKRDGELGSGQRGSSLSPELPAAHRISSCSSVYVVGVSLVIMLPIIFMGIWSCFGS
ncbi:hypothetical protein L1049_021845 [Liquidambar formosana]|uniref:Uncharacterized protein n=1 Tax=Liquidambar formosana TaxID=63359 RepID=A0AAP0RBG9_LIQFO